MTISELQQKIDVLNFEHFRLTANFNQETAKCLTAVEVSENLTALRIELEQIGREIDYYQTLIDAVCRAKAVDTSQALNLN